MRIVCILGRSGSGKSTIERRLEKLGFNRIISYTTRKVRGEEVDGVDYNFVTKDEFIRLLSKGILMEHTEYRGNFYGAPKPVGGVNHVIVVESEGFEKIKETYGSQVTGVYVDIPIEVAIERLNSRNDTPDIEKKLRAEEDSAKFSDIKNKVDIVVDGRKPVDDLVAEILEFIRSKE